MDQTIKNSGVNEMLKLLKDEVFSDKALKISWILNKTSLSDSDLTYLNDEIEDYLTHNKEVKIIKVPVENVNNVSTKGKYPNLFENLNILDDDLIKQIKREASRYGAKDLKNACRTILRHRGYNC